MQREIEIGQVTSQRSISRVALRGDPLELEIKVVVLFKFQEPPQRVGCYALGSATDEARQCCSIVNKQHSVQMLLFFQEIVSTLLLV